MNWIYGVLILIVIISCVSAFFSTPKGKGIVGEYKTKLVLGRNKPNKQYTVHNILFFHDDKTVQIDHVLINKQGVFVLETKNYCGQIYGRENDQHWTETFYQNKFQFYNPIEQNKGHIYHLNKAINAPFTIPFHSIIVFTHYVSLKVNSITPVVQLGKLRKTIANTKSERTLSAHEISFCYNTILKLKDSTATLRMHLKNIKKMKTNIDHNICPRCGKPLILRHGKTGDFYGCTGYPSCRFVKRK